MIEINNIIKKYNENKENECIAVNGVSLKINTGDFIAIMGKSGSGKSTLLHLIAGIDFPTSGEIKINGQKITGMKDSTLAEYRNKNIGIILQQFFLINECNVLDNIILPLNFTSMKRKDKLKRATKLICQLDLEKYVKKPVMQLSGGEKQRVAIARALINEPNLILADEPTGSLDEENSGIIMQMLQRINKKLGKTIMIITHDKDVANYCNRIITIHDGKIIKDKSISKKIE